MTFAISVPVVVWCDIPCVQDVLGKKPVSASLVCFFSAMLYRKRFLFQSLTFYLPRLFQFLPLLGLFTSLLIPLTLDPSLVATLWFSGSNKVGWEMDARINDSQRMNATPLFTLAIVFHTFLVVGFFFFKLYSLIPCGHFLMSSAQYFTLPLKLIELPQEGHLLLHQVRRKLRGNSWSLSFTPRP